MQLIIYLIICLCGLSLSAVAQHMPTSAMSMLTYRDGLAGSSVNDILVGFNGEMWLATNNGINTYNGKSLAIFGLGDASQSNPVYHIYKSPDHHIYAVSQQGIFRYEYGHKNFDHILPQIKTAVALLPLGHDSLMIGNNDGLHLYDGRQLQTIHTGITAAGNAVQDIKLGPDGRIWVASKDALLAFTPANKQIETICSLARTMPGMSLNQIALYGDKCYMGTKNHGLFILHIPSRELKHVDGVGNNITSLRTTRDGLLCIGTDGSGAYLLHPDSDNNITQFNIIQDGMRHLVSNAVNCYYRDDNDIDWFGYSQFGLSHTFHFESLFKPFRYKTFTTEGLTVHSYLIEDRYCLIGTDDGFYFIDRERDLVKHFSPENLDGGRIVTSIVHFDSCFYIGSYEGGVQRFDPRTMAVSKFQHPRLKQVKVTKLIVNPVRGTLNIGTSEGLFVQRLNGEIVTFNEVNSKLGSSDIVDISFNAEGNSWLSTAEGLTFYIQANDQFISKGFPSGFFNHVSSLKGYPGHDNLHFFYCADNIYYTDEDMQDFGLMHFPSFLDRELSLSFVDDMQGHYWVSNERGLFCIDYDIQHMQYFNEAEGITCQFITEASLQIDDSGILWLGSSNGLYYANLTDIEKWKNHVHNNILLYNIQRGEDQLSETEQLLINDRKTLSLSWNFTSEKLRVLPVVTDYSRSDYHIFEYRIDNGKTWTLIDEGSPIEIKHLNLGRHSLHVRLSGLPNTEQTYSITVDPSLAAVIEFLLLAMAIALLVWWKRYRKRTQLLLEERNIIEEALIEVETANEQEEQLPERQKYDRVKLNDAECEQIVHRVRKYLETEKVYLNPELKMSELAEALQLSPSKLSQVFNLYLKENYYEFINNYRLNEFKRRIEAGDAKLYTLIALSEKCGFKKSSFFATFRRVEGMTPTEYLKKTHHI